MFAITPKIFEEVASYFSSIAEIGRPRQFDKGELIFSEGDIVDHLFYMNSGLVKCFQLQEGKEIILRLMTDNSAVLAYSGFITNQSSSEYIECLEPCYGYWVPLSALERLRAERAEVESVFRYLAEQHYLSMERRLLMLHHKSSLERYAYFCQHMERKIVERSPKHCIASYLGVTPESFSRMKRKLIN